MGLVEAQQVIEVRLLADVQTGKTYVRKYHSMLGLIPL